MPKKQEDQTEELQKQIDELNKRLDDTTNQLKRAVADYRNLEARVSEARGELGKWATTELIKSLLPVLDHLDQALTGADENDKQSGWFKGVELAVKELKDVLKKEGLDEIEADGQFDPNLHEAVDIVDIKEGEDNTILEVSRKGHTLNGKVLRPAYVVVGKKVVL